MVLPSLFPFSSYLSPALNAGAGLGIIWLRIHHTTCGIGLRFFLVFSLSSIRYRPAPPLAVGVWWQHVFFNVFVDTLSSRPPLCWRYGRGFRRLTVFPVSLTDARLLVYPFLVSALFRSCVCLPFRGVRVCSEEPHIRLMF